MAIRRLSKNEIKSLRIHAGQERWPGGYLLRDACHLDHGLIEMGLLRVFFEEQQRFVAITQSGRKVLADYVPA